MNRLAQWSSSHSTNHPHTFLIYLTHSGIYPSFILLQHYTEHAHIRHHILKVIPPSKVHCVCVDDNVRSISGCLMQCTTALTFGYFNL